MANVSTLVDEYRALFGGASTGMKESFEELLVREGDWTLRGASDLLQLAHQYGSFMLRNALAISLALEIEDGDLGF
jgi:hypothetical protein